MERGVYRLKQGGFKELAPKMAEEMSLTAKERFPLDEIDMVCPVPMTKKKEEKRGYNQATILASELARWLNIPYESLLIKPRETPSQRTSSAKDRKLNLYGAFEVKQREAVKGKTILLVDDVKTTGNTLNECAATLRANKAKAVYATAFTVTNKKETKHKK